MLSKLLASMLRTAAVGCKDATAASGSSTSLSTTMSTNSEFTVGSQPRGETARSVAVPVSDLDRLLI
jgi:hypothetical protein